MIVACVAVGFTAATQYVADRLGYHPNLGPPLYPADSYSPFVCLATAIVAAALAAACARSPSTRRASPVLGLVAMAGFAAARGPFYAPGRVIQWGMDYHRATSAEPSQWEQLRPIFDGAYPVGIAAFFVALCALGYAFFGSSVKHASNAHGTAEFGTGAELLIEPEEERRRQLEPGKAAESGVMVGRMPPRPGGWSRRGAVQPGRLLWYDGPSHILTMAPTRSGKGVGAVVPTLLRYPGSVVCMDIKGENFHVTHAQRILDGGEVFVLDPFRVTGDDHSLHAFANPLDTIDTRGVGANRALDYCKTLAEMLVAEEGKENKHFSDEGRSLLACFMLYVCDEYHSERHERTLMKVRDLLTLPAEKFAQRLEQMAASDNPLVQRGVARLLQKEERERTAVISTAQRGIDFLDSIPMANVLVPPAGSDLEAAADTPRPRQVNLALLKSDKPITIYLVIPPEALKTHAAWIRMMIACINNMITRIPGRPTYRILMLLDEFAQLGHIRPVIEGISLVGGYGVLFWIIIQDLAQLKGLYKDNWETIFANCDVKQCFGTNDWSTADLLSKMTGETTVFTEGGSSGKGRSYGKSSGHSTNYGESVSEKGRRLVMPDEVMRLSPSKQLLFVKGSAPLLVNKINYLTDPEFRRSGNNMFGANPMYS